MNAAILSSGQAGPTPALLAFCKQLPEECALNPSEPAAITLDSEIWKLISEVNERVNATILPVTDQDHWGVADRWDYPDDGMGDCEDIQLLNDQLFISSERDRNCRPSIRRFALDGTLLGEVPLPPRFVTVFPAAEIVIGSSRFAPVLPMVVLFANPMGDAALKPSA